nr:MAG TPA: hypothetical protein [Caudoviricetes sp.]
MENEWYGQFTFDQVEKLRADAEADPAIKADIQLAAGNDAELTEMILKGPDSALIDELQAAAEDDPIHADFDAVWGAGAAEYYASQYGFWDNVLEIPGAAVRGVAGAAAEGQEFVANYAAIPVGELLFGSKEDEANNQVERMRERVAALEAQGADEGPLSAAREALAAAEAEVASINGMDASEKEKYNNIEAEFDADTFIKGAIAKPETMTGAVTEGIVQFTAPFLTMAGGATRLASLLTSTSVKARSLGLLVSGFVTDFAFFDEDDPLVVTALADALGVESQIVDDYLRFTDDRNDADRRFMRAIEGGVIGKAIDVAAVGAAAAIKKFRGKPDAGPALAKEMEKILDGIDPLDVDVPAGAVDLDATTLWHLDVEAGGKGVVAAERGEAAGAARAVEGEAVEAEAKSADAVEDETPKLDSLPPRFSKVLEETTGETATPKVSHAERNRAILLAKKLYLAARETDASKAWDAAVESLRATADTLGEAAVRTKDQLADALIRPYNSVAKWVESGNLDALVKFANEPGSILDFRLRSAAMQLAAKGLREQTDKMATLYEASLATGKMTAHDEAVMREVLHKQIQFAMEVEALNTNMGSAAGALLGQRAGHMNVVDMLTKKVQEAAEAARQAGKSKAEIKKARVNARREAIKEMREELKANAKKGNANFVAREYRRLVKEGVDPILAYKRVKATAKEADTQGVPLNPKMNDEAKALDMAEKVKNEGPIHKLFRGLEQWRYNAMLSGIRTHETNILSTLSQLTSRLAYEAVFGLIRGDKQMVTAAGRKATGMITGMKESASYALQAFKEMRPILDEVTAFERLDPVYKNTILTYPTRLMLGLDQFVKQLAYRGEIKAKALEEADLAGLKGADRQAYLDKRTAAAFTEDGAGTDMLAINRANEVTFQKQYDPKSKYWSDRSLARANEILSETYVGRLMFPFMRIFFRLTEEGIRLTPGLREGIGLVTTGLEKAGVNTGGSKYFDDLFGKNGKAQQARAAGEYAVGLALTAWTVALVAEGKITGNEERVFADAMLRKKVVPPYSIQIGDQWYDYSRFEPFAFPMKFWANTLIGMRERNAAEERGEYEDEQNQMVQAIGASAYALAAQLSSNSFMEGIESLVKATSGSYDEGEAWKRPVQTLADSYVPNILRKLNEVFDDSGEKYRADPLTLEAFGRNFSSVINTESFDLDRNLFLGEPYVYTDTDDMAGNTSFVGKDVNNDPVMKMLIEANENTGIQPLLKRSTAFFKGADLKKVPQDGGGRSLYDQYLDKVSTLTDDNGLTYRDRLEQLATSPEFQAIPWGNKTHVRGAKADAIYEIKREFEDRAQKWMEDNSKSFAYLAGRQAMFERKQAQREQEALEAHKTGAEVLGLD